VAHESGAALAALPQEFQHMVAHHGQMTAQLRARVDALRAAVASHVPFGAEQAAVREFLETQVVPHARAEEDVVYRAGASSRALSALVIGMTMEHETLLALAGDVAAADDGVGAASAATAFQALFEVHVRKENELLLPHLAVSGVDAESLHAEMEASFGKHRDAARAAAAR
jgi:hypothetical protein